MQKVRSSNKAGFVSLLRVFRETDLSQEKTRVHSIRNEKDLAEAVKKLGNQEKVGQSFYILYF